MLTEALDRLIGIPGVDAAMPIVDARVEELLSGEDSPFDAAARRVAGAGGKRLRPALTYACSTFGAPDPDRVLNAAVAVELVQVGSLVHDDIFEGATVRRGVSTINAVEGDDFALMAGDYILARAGQAAAAAGSAVARTLALTVEELCVGQLIETTELFDLDRTIDSQLLSIRRKTGVLYSCACRFGGLCADVGDALNEALGDFGENFGMAFQLVDDVLDLVSDESRLGKPCNIDIATGVYTMPVLLALESPAGAELRKTLAIRDADAAREVVLRAGTIPAVISRARDFASRAADVLEGASAAPPSELIGFPSRYVDWALDHFPTDHALLR